MVKLNSDEVNEGKLNELTKFTPVQVKQLQKKLGFVGTPKKIKKKIWLRHYYDRLSSTSKACSSKTR